MGTWLSSVSYLRMQGILSPEGVSLTFQDQVENGDQQAEQSLGASVLVSAACCCLPRGGLAQSWASLCCWRNTLEGLDSCHCCRNSWLGLARLFRTHVGGFRTLGWLSLLDFLSLHFLSNVGWSWDCGTYWRWGVSHTIILSYPFIDSYLFLLPSLAQARVP